MAMLDGKAGIVTGAAQGFGRATAERLCADCVLRTSHQNEWYQQSTHH